MRLESFIHGKWSVGQDMTEVHSAVTGDVIALATGNGFDMREILAFGRTIGGNNLTIARGPKNQNQIEKRSDVVLFTSEPRPSTPVDKRWKTPRLSNFVQDRPMRKKPFKAGKCNPHLVASS